jgi:phosphate starvation-inducible membrane PsiE
MSENKSHAGAIAAHYLSMTETVVLTLVAIVLVVLSVLLLGSSVLALYNSVILGQIRDSAIEILDSVLLVMMTMEIVYTVTLSLQSHTLAAEPFLVVGTIAAIRRMLVITAESTRLETSNPDAFRNTLIELGLLAVTIIVLAISIYVIRRSQTMIPAGDLAAKE